MLGTPGQCPHCGAAKVERVNARGGKFLGCPKGCKGRKKPDRSKQEPPAPQRKEAPPAPAPEPPQRKRTPPARKPAPQPEPKKKSFWDDFFGFK